MYLGYQQVTLPSDATDSGNRRLQVFVDSLRIYSVRFFPVIGRNPAAASYIRAIADCADLARPIFGRRRISRRKNHDSHPVNFRK